MTPGRKVAARAVVSRRGELHLRQSDLAQESGVSVRAIQKLESGETWPWVRTRQAISRALGMPQTWIDDLAADAEQRPEGTESPYTGAEAELYAALLEVDMPDADRRMLVSVYRAQRESRDEAS